MPTTRTAFAGSVWSSPHASKHALLIHGITSSSQTWYSVANSLAARGYHVTAPDLLGHGTARRGTGYTISALAEELQPFVAGVYGADFGGYDLIVGHSLGALVTLAFLSSIPPGKPVRVVLLDPPLEIAPETESYLRGLFADQATSVRTLEQHLSDHPLWTRKDAALEVLGNNLCTSDVTDAIFEQNGHPWSFTYLLNQVPAYVTLKILAADPSLWSLCKVEHAPAFTQVVLGASHSIERECPEAVLKAALDPALDDPSDISTVFAGSVWGSSNATKRALLIHGLTSSSASSWFRIARGLVDQGYFVTAPDYHGHGIAGRGTDYRISALAESLHPFFTNVPTSQGYDVIIGHSLGGLVALSLLPIIGASNKRTRVILVDPPLEQGPALVAHYRKLFVDYVTDVRPMEALLKESPPWTREDAAWHVLSHELCDPQAVDAIFEKNTPWSFGHMLADVPPNVELTVMAADPSLGASFRVEEASAYPHVQTQVVFGSTHLIPKEFPEVIIDVALRG
ncbi:alpha beta-hydrolase [Leucogyrophana mollusca]|uniref:Alpha beta-hydrolase n=1 Tax=Leucogyrophana mollusca TaxID=85980 RepID=A0ACB8BX28_9AGAM|nr:alpha beta-hydrolase [Leucogyrophana mollusca]